VGLDSPTGSSSEALTCGQYDVYGYDQVAFSGTTFQSNGSYLLSGDYTKEIIMQSDLNLVMYCVNGTSNCHCSNPQFQGDYVQTADGKWTPYYWCPYAATGSAAEHWGNKLVAQGDGNLVLYMHNCTSSGCVVRTRLGPTGTLPSGTNQRGSRWLRMQNDGNLVIYDGTGCPLWATGTANYGKLYGAYPQCPSWYFDGSGDSYCYRNTPLGTFIFTRYASGSRGTTSPDGSQKTCTADGSTCTTWSAHGYNAAVCNSSGCRIYFYAPGPNAGGHADCNTSSGNCTYYDASGFAFTPPRPPSFQAYHPGLYPGPDPAETMQQYEELVHAISEFLDAMESPDII
jgi:hypothetical protein